jgi:hypothetical protein
MEKKTEFKGKKTVFKVKLLKEIVNKKNSRVYAKDEELNVISLEGSNNFVHYTKPDRVTKAQSMDMIPKKDCVVL